MDADAKLEKLFDLEMEQIYLRAKAEAKYTASAFHQMLQSSRGVATARTLINAARESQGYTELYLRKRLDLTVEAVVVENPRWHPLFTAEEIERARSRLAKYDYIFKPKA